MTGGKTPSGAPLRPPKNGPASGARRASLGPSGRSGASPPGAVRPRPLRIGRSVVIRSVAPVRHGRVEGGKQRGTRGVERRSSRQKRGSLEAFSM